MTTPTKSPQGERKITLADLKAAAVRAKAEKACRIEPRFFHPIDAARICRPRGDHAIDAFEHGIAMDEAYDGGDY